MNDEQLTTRLRAASEGIELSDAAQARHLEAIAAALDGVPALTPRRHRRFVASLVAAALIAPAGLAAASEGTVPGDALYGVKRISERVIVLFDGDVIARHRVEEIEALENDATPELYERARAALTELDRNHPLWQRFEASDHSAGAPIADREDEPPSADGRSVDETPTDSTERDVGLPDGVTAVVTVDRGRITDVAAPAGWTIAEFDENEITMRSETREVEIELRDDGSLVSKVTAEFDGAPGDDSTSGVGESDDDASDDSPASDTDPDDDDESDRGDDDDSTDD